jgi:hypothetical protein
MISILRHEHCVDFPQERINAANILWLVLGLTQGNNNHLVAEVEFD